MKLKIKNKKIEVANKLIIKSLIYYGLYAASIIVFAGIILWGLSFTGFDPMANNSALTDMAIIAIIVAIDLALTQSRKLSPAVIIMSVPLAIGLVAYTGIMNLIKTFVATYNNARTTIETPVPATRRTK
jgi:magnesium-transporting ATPase (P-type)